MSAFAALLTTRAVASYFALTFIVSWGGVLLVAGPGIFIASPDEVRHLLPFAVMAMIAGPSLSGLLVIGVAGGRAAMREFFSSLRRWRVGGRWYAAAVLTAPALMAGILLPLSLFSSQFLPRIVTSVDRGVVLITGLTIALAAGVFEEVGWTGFAIPALRARHGMLATGLIVGVAWAAWHLLVAVWALGPSPGAVVATSYALDPLLFLTAFRVLMVWVYDRTHSVLLAMLMHVSLTATARILGAPELDGIPLLLFDVLWSLAVSVVIAVVLSRHRSAAAEPNAAATSRPFQSAGDPQFTREHDAIRRVKKLPPLS